VETSDLVAPEDIPAPPHVGWRVSISDFKIRWKFEPHGRNHLTMTFVLDPRVHGVQSLVNFALKRVAGPSLGRPPTHPPILSVPRVKLFVCRSITRSVD
jgi:hypothetical protein